MKIKKRQIIATILIVLFLILLVLVSSKGVLGIDKAAINFVLSIRNDFLTNFFKIITKLCNGTYLLIITAILLIIFRDRKESILIPINLGVSVLLNQVFKSIIRRPRPEYKLIKQGGYSFPSGHAMLAVAFYGLLLYLVNRHVKKKALRIILSTLLIILMILIGFSRIYLGVHYLSDVIAGYSLGIIYLVIFIEIVNRKKGNDEKEVCQRRNKEKKK